MKILAPLFALGLALSTLSGCSGSSASDDANTADESAADALTSSQRNTLILHVRAAFEKASASDSTGLVGSKTIDPSKLKGDARKAFMSECLKDKQGAQQERMKACNKEAGDKKLKGDARKAFMSECLKADKPAEAKPAEAVPAEPKPAAAPAKK